MADHKSDAYRSTDFTLALDDRIRAYQSSVARDKAYAGFDTQSVGQAEFVSADVASRTTFFRFTVTPRLCNKDGNLHGGAASTIFDNLSSTALFTISRPGFWDNLGVSRVLAVHFHRPLSNDSEVRLVCQVVSAGKRMACVRAEMISSDGKVCASCTHEKVRIEAPNL